MSAKHFSNTKRARSVFTRRLFIYCIFRDGNGEAAALSLKEQQQYQQHPLSIKHILVYTYNSPE